VILLFHWNRQMGQFQLAQSLVDTDALTLDLPGRLYCTRTLNRADSIRQWDDGLAALGNSDVKGWLRGARLLAQAMLAAIASNHRRDALAVDHVAEACTSVSIALEVTA